MRNVKRIIGVFAVGLGTLFVGMRMAAGCKKGNFVYEKEPEQKNPMAGKRVEFIEDETDEENADGVRGHLEAVGDSECKNGIYDTYVKRGLDVVISFLGLLVLSPVYALISLAIIVDDPGPVLFTQKRIGKNKEYFKLHKFRSMKMSTPHDVPTHMLENPDQYITRVGKFIRLHSLDELPQIWDIFVGNMSIIGPRPALWNQDLLTAERDKYGANDVKPGLTGWAQINGRDELSISDKAKLDGEYAKKQNLFFDVKCFWGTIKSVVKADGIVEGGTGAMSQKLAKEYCEDIGRIGLDEPANIDMSVHRKVLITGAGSYIGESFEAYANENYHANFSVETIDMLDEKWRTISFSGYDTVFHVAGIAHADVGEISEEMKKKYYAVNTDLAIDVAQKAKEAGVHQFVFMSSMIVYGESAEYGKNRVITKETCPAPANCYGDSKWRADKGVRSLEDEKFKVTVLRPPMIYGKGSKGNYPLLEKVAKRSPVFPAVRNERSMLYIDNLCEFLCKIMLLGKGGVFAPQNAEYTNTSEMVKMISEVFGREIKETALLKPAVSLGSRIPGRIGRMINKAFGNVVYAKDMSEYPGLDYRVVKLKESIKKTACREVYGKKILFLVNHDVVIYNFRLELVERLLSEGYEVHISSPYGERIEDLKKLGAVYHKIEMDRHGMNPVAEIQLLRTYVKLLKEVKPKIVLGYTIKPNIYGAMAAQAAKVPFVANITGLGTAVENGGITQRITVALYKIAFRRVQKVFFQNEENRKFFLDHKIAVNKHDMLPGSGVNLKRFTVSDYTEDKCVKFLFISRIMKEKGIDQYLDAAELIKKEYPDTEFHICGFCEAEYEGKLNECIERGLVRYHGMIRDVSGFMKGIHCVVHPTYYPEGLSNVLLEACASGRPIITTDRSGCREVVEDGVNGFMIPPKDSKKLVEAIEKFLKLTWKEKKAMGLAGRRKVEKEFDRQIVVEAYMKEVALCQNQ